MQERDAPLGRQVAQPRLEQLLAEHEVAEQPALVRQADLRAVGELARLAEVVDDRRRHEQVGVQPRVQLARLQRERADRDRVLEQPAEVGVMAGARARRAPPLGAQRGVAEQAVEQRPVARLVDLAREVLEEAVELVEVAVGDRQERRRVGAVGALDRAHVDLQLVAEALDAALHAHEVAALEAAPEQVGVAEHARRHRAGAVAQLERQVRRAGPRGQAVLARARVDAGDLVAGAQRAELCRGHPTDDGAPSGRERRSPSATVVGHAAAALGSPAGRAPGPRAGVRLQGLERRRRVRLVRADVPRRRAWAPSASR